MKISILNIAKKEVMDNIRSKWIIFISISFAILAIVSSYFGSTGTGWRDFEYTMRAMILFIQFFIPIIGLILGYGSIRKEVETGTMNALISFPISRFEIIIGKFIGLATVLASSIFLGFIIAGAIIGLNVPNADYGLYFVFIIESILLGLAFLSFSMFFSVVAKRISTSIGASIFLWLFFLMIWGIMISGLNVDIPNSSNLANFLFSFNMLNPIASYVALVALNVNFVPSFLSLSSNSEYFPEFYNNSNLLLAMIFWIILMLVLSSYIFKKHDIH